MTENRLNIISVTSKKSLDHSYQDSRNIQKKELQAKFERLWLVNSERFNPLRNCIERERLERTWHLINKYVVLSDHPRTVDIACAAGVFSRRLRDAGAQVEGIDIAENALKKFKELGDDKIVIKQDAMPNTHLPDQSYRLVICTELIAELPREDYRLFFAELARIIHPDGYLVCSSPIDINSTQGVERLVELAQSEFDILEDFPSYHALYLRIKHLLNASTRFKEGWENSTTKHREMAHLKGFNRMWYWLNTTPLFVWFWYACDPCLFPLRKIIRSNSKILLFLEKLCRFFSDQDGISHYLFIARRRPLPNIHLDDIPKERPKRKEIWD